MRIGIDLRLHAYAPGGISRYARRLAVELSHLLDPRHLLLVPHRRERAPLPLPGVRVHRAWTPAHHRLERWTLGAELLPLRLDLFHSTDFIPVAWGVRHTVITVHDLNFLYYPEYLTPAARRYYNDQIVWATQHADAILADSHATQRDLVQLLGVPADRIATVPLAADEHYRPLAAERLAAALAHCGVEPGYLLFVGTWEPRKNIPALLEALALLRAQGQSCRLVIAGRPGWLYDSIFSRMQELHLEPWIKLIENPDRDTLVALYGGALAVVLPSFYEGFGLPALEAMQCGTPVVVSDRASLPEVVGDAGLLIDPEAPETIAQACGRLLQDPDLVEQLRELGLRQARRFSWQATAQATLAVYEAVVR